MSKNGNTIVQLTELQKVNVNKLLQYNITLKMGAKIRYNSRPTNKVLSNMLLFFPGDRMTVGSQ